MQPLNAIDAIAPAFTRTHQTLFHPFRIGRSWKLAASQYLGFCGAMFFPVPFFFLLIPTSVPIPRQHLLILSLIPTILSLIVVYLCGRMEMVCFEMVVTRGKFVAPMWRRYSARVWLWIGLKILVGTVVTLLLGALLIGPLRHAVQNMISSFPAGAIPQGPSPDPAEMQAILAPFMQQASNFELLLFAISFLLKIPSTLLQDFVMPFYILEDIPLFEAIRRAFAVFVADPLQVLLYLILKPILFVIGYIIQNIVISITTIPFVIVAVIGGIVGGVSMRGGASTGAFLIIAGIILLIAFMAFIFWEVFFVFGYLLTLLEAYGVYFLAGRYPLLASLLEPGPDKPFTPPPVFPSEDELRDNGGGPPMPMDPAVA